MNTPTNQAGAFQPAIEPQASPVSQTEASEAQLRRFVAWERENDPKHKHVADWALGEIERLRAVIAKFEGACRVYLVASGETSQEGRHELYERYDGLPPPLCDYETLYMSPNRAGHGAPEGQAVAAKDEPIGVVVNDAGGVTWWDDVPARGTSVYRAPHPIPRASTAGVRVPPGLIEALRRQRQVDEDGTECGVDREAVDVAINILAMLATSPAPPAEGAPRG